MTINMKKVLVIITLLAIGYWLLAPVAFAQGGQGIWAGTSGTDGCNVAETGCNLCDAAVVTQNIIIFLTKVAIPLAVAMIVWGAIIFMTAAGSEDRVKKGKDTITKAVIGLIIVLAAWTIVNVTLHTLTGGVSWPWQTIAC